ncbi:MAG: hypothetical protein AAFX04_06265 [Pseudomonadota bacterium]
MAEAPPGDSNMPQVSDVLYQQFAQHKADADHVERVIITYEKKSARPDIALPGVEIVSEMKSTPIIICNVTLKGLQTLAKIEGIRRIEPDGMMGIPEQQ